MNKSKLWRYLFYLFKLIPSILKYILYKNTFNKINVSFSLVNSDYSSFYEPIISRLKGNERYNLITFSHVQQKIKTYSPFLQYFITEPLIILCVDTDRIYRKKKKHKILKMNHGFGSLGSIFGDEFITKSDALLIPCPHIEKQLHENHYANLVKTYSVNVYKTGYPKLDDLFEDKYPDKESLKNIFYGPTYHLEFSTIFDWHEPIFDLAKKIEMGLIIKLHPMLYDMKNRLHSGGIDWIKKLSNLAKKKDVNLEIVPNVVSNKELKEAFYKTAVFLTDVSGIGFEFVLATGRPILFLGNKIKIPPGEEPKKYKEYGEIKIRKKIGPIVTNKNTLQDEIEKILAVNRYKTEIENFRNSFVYNLGTATNSVITSINEEYRKVTRINE